MELLPVHLTQQDFVSTFPWGFRGDAVRILQQEVENELLDAETLSAMASMLGDASRSPRLDEAWKLLLNSQNHDVHVCLFDEVGIDWCKAARAIVGEVRTQAGDFIVRKAGAANLDINTLSWARRGADGKTVPAFGFAAADAPKAQSAATRPWKGWFETDTYLVRVLDNGCLETQLKGFPDRIARLGNLTLWRNGREFDTAAATPSSIETHLSADGSTAIAKVAGMVGDVGYSHVFTASADGIDVVTEIDYADGRFFGPEPEDIQREPVRRAHYFQHDRKLCLNGQVPSASPRALYNSPFLTWPAAQASSIDSLHYLALDAGQWGLAHFNIGQSGYHYNDKESLLRHVLGYAPRKFVYGSEEKLRLSGKHVHSSRFVPYAGDWRCAKLPLRSAEFGRPVMSVQAAAAAKATAAKGSLVQIDSNSTVATALFERGGRVFIRLWEWAGQEDRVTLSFGDAGANLIECNHRLAQQGKLAGAFTLRPWEVKTIELAGKAKLLDERNGCSAARRFASVPQGWANPNLFESNGPRAPQPLEITPDAPVYFLSGYHDGFVRPLEKPTDTMRIEMERVHSSLYRSYTSSWEIGANCWDRIVKNDPEYLTALKPYLQEGTIELVGGTWSEPLSLIVSAESNVRQFMYGLETIEQLLGVQVRVYMNQEHATFAQMPQLLSSFGLTTVVNRTQWAPFGIESGLNVEVAQWVGPDGSTIQLVPRYNSMNYLMGTHRTELANDNRFQHDSLTGHNRYWRSEELFTYVRDQARLLGVDKPLVTMLEDIWDVGLRSTDEEMAQYNSFPFVQFTTIAGYLKLFGLEVEPAPRAQGVG